MKAEVKALVKEVKDLFNNFKIDETAILQPTLEFMIRFYSHLLSEFQEIVADALRMPLQVRNWNNEQQLEPEQIYKQISQIASNESLKFNLSDVYQPTFVRTKSFIRICLHFLSFSMSILEDIELLSASVLEMKENTVKLMSEKQEYLEIIDTNAVTKADLLAENQKLVHDLKQVKIACEEMLDSKMNKEIIHEDMKKQIEILTQEIENEEIMHDKENAERKYLVEQTITESEYNNLLQMLNSMQCDLKIANEEEAYVGELLSEENEVLKHIEDCRKTVPELTEFNLEPIQKFIHSREQVNDSRKEVEKLVKTVNSLNQEVESGNNRLMRIRESFHKIKTAHEEAKSQYLEARIALFQTNMKLKEQVEEEFKAFQSNLSASKNQLTRQNRMKEKLTLLLHQEFSKIFQAEQLSMVKFTEIMKSYRNWNHCR